MLIHGFNQGQVATQRLTIKYVLATLRPQADCASMQYAEKAKEAMSSLPKVFASKLGIPFSNLAKPSSSRFETLIQFSTSELYSNHHCWFLEASEPDI
ncbi:hypothetical protein CISIN_1g034014mg [Citrus sinensis]|uniref:Uncharacterized protein n=1 Tax=Citrus sinensis TaxID=2711 RepID=A0A067E4K7_CITSI|nr:hypothetical protein CISIN_1g034014mg [Citrus sinensis]